MTRGLRRAHENEEGLALVVALMVTLLVFILTTAILADAFHNVVGSANARGRLAAINAAEAGVAWYSRSLESYLPTTALSSLQTTLWQRVPGDSTGNKFEMKDPLAVRGAPVDGSFRLTATYYMKSDYTFASDALAPCVGGGCVTFAAATDATLPTKFRVELVSVGTAGGVSRSVRAVMELVPQHAALRGAFAGIYICELGNRFTITGSNADVYLLAASASGSDCPAGGHTSTSATDILAVTSGQFTTSGSVYALYGGVCLTNTTKIDGSLWAAGRIILGGPTNCTGGGAASSASTCSSTSPASILICGDATSLEASPTVGSGAKVLGTAGQCFGCPLTTLTFTAITKEQAISTFTGWATGSSTTLLESLATTPSSSDTLFTIADGCTTPLTFTKTLYLKKDIAIVSPCGFTFAKKVEIRASATTTPTLYLFTGSGSGTCTDAMNTTMSQNFDSTAVKLFLYNPCKLTFTNQVNITGQLLARTLYAKGRTTINAVDVLGLTSNQTSPVSGFLSRVLNIREV